MAFITTGTQQNVRFETYQHMLRGLDGLEPDEGDLHREDCADHVDGGVGHVHPLRRF